MGTREERAELRARREVVTDQELLARLGTVFCMKCSAPEHHNDDSGYVLPLPWNSELWVCQKCFIIEMDRRHGSQEKKT